MGSTMKRSIFDEQTSKALKQWHMKAVKKTHDGKPEHTGTRALGGSPGDSPTHAHNGAQAGGDKVADVEADQTDITGDQDDPKNPYSQHDLRS